MRGKIKAWSKSLFLALLGAIFFGLVAQYAIQIAADKGYYRHAGERWDKAVGAVLHLLTSKYIVVMATVSGAFFVGLKVDGVFTRREMAVAAETTPRSATLRATMHADDQALVERVRQFATGYLDDALAAAHEAQRLSAYVLKDLWSGHPTAKWGYTGILLSTSYDPTEIKRLQDSTWLRTASLDVVQNLLLSVVRTYALKTHGLRDFLAHLKSEGQIGDLHSFPAALHVWWKAHQEMLVAFDRLKTTNGLPILRDYKLTEHLLDPNYAFTDFEDMNGQP